MARRRLRILPGLEAAAGLEAAQASMTAALASRSGIRSPMSNGALQTIPWREWYAGDSDALPVGRADALTIPSVVRAVAQVTSALASCPWVKLAGDAPASSQPAWLYSTAGDVAPQYRTAFVVEDLILNGWSLLDLERDGRGVITSAVRRRPDLWGFDDTGAVIDSASDEVIAPKAYALVKGPHDGILRTGARTLRGAIALETAWTKAVRNPTPIQILQQVNDDQLEEDEITDLLADWVTARQGADGTVAYLPAGVELKTPGEVSPELLVAARNAVAVDVARLVGLPSAAVDAGSVQQSLTYTNTSVGVGLQLVTQGFKPYADAIGAALSMDNVTNPGTRIALDMSQLLADAATLSPSGTPTKD